MSFGHKKEIFSGRKNTVHCVYMYMALPLHYSHYSIFNNLYQFIPHFFINIYFAYFIFKVILMCIFLSFTCDIQGSSEPKNVIAGSDVPLLPVYDSFKNLKVIYNSTAGSIRKIHITGIQDHLNTLSTLKTIQKYIPFYASSVTRSDTYYTFQYYNSEFMTVQVLPRGPLYVQTDAESLQSLQMYATAMRSHC